MSILATLPEQLRSLPAIDPVGKRPSEIARELERRILLLDEHTDHRYALDYCSSSGYLADGGKDDRPLRERMRWMAVWPVTGGSEGWYIHVDAVYQTDEKGNPTRDAAGNFTNVHRPIVLIKTFGGWSEAAELAGEIGRWLDA